MTYIIANEMLGDQQPTTSPRRELGWLHMTYLEEQEPLSLQ